MGFGAGIGEATGADNMGGNGAEPAELQVLNQ